MTGRSRDTAHDPRWSGAVLGEKAASGRDQRLSVLSRRVGGFWKGLEEVRNSQDAADPKCPDWRAAERDGQHFKAGAAMGWHGMAWDEEWTWELGVIPKSPRTNFLTQSEAFGRRNSLPPQEDLDAGNPKFPHWRTAVPDPPHLKLGSSCRLGNLWDVIRWAEDGQRGRDGDEEQS